MPAASSLRLTIEFLSKVLFFFLPHLCKDIFAGAMYYYLVSFHLERVAANAVTRQADKKLEKICQIKLIPVQNFHKRQKHLAKCYRFIVLVPRHVPLRMNLEVVIGLFGLSSNAFVIVKNMKRNPFCVNQTHFYWTMLP